MKIIAAAALLASSFTPMAIPGFVSEAAATPVSLSNCNIHASAKSGWVCDERISSQIYYSDAQTSAAGGDITTTCQDYVRTTADYVAINPAGRPSATFTQSGVTTDATDGGQYDGTLSGCNYPALQ